MPRLKKEVAVSEKDDFSVDTAELKKVSGNSKFVALKKQLKSSKHDFMFVEEISKNPVIPSSVWGFDYVTAIGGAPLGRSIEFNGKEASGKTTLALSIAAQAQRIGKHVLYLDYEHALDTVYAAKQGLDFNPDLLTIERPMSIEEGEKIFDAFMALGESIVIIQDSLPAMIPNEFLINPESRIKRPGLQARLQGEFFNKAVRYLAKTNSMLISLNQMRSNFSMGGGPASFLAPKEKSSGGFANKHFQSMIFNISVIGKEQSTIDSSFEGEAIKQDTFLKVRITNKKNKVGRPFLGAVMYLEIGGGFDNIRNLLEAAIKKKLVKKSGAWLSCKLWDVTQIQGLSKAGAYLRANEDLIEKMLLEMGWLTSEGVIDLSNTYSRYNSDPLKDDDDEDFTDDDSEDEDSEEYVD